MYVPSELVFVLNVHLYGWLVLAAGVGWWALRGGPRRGPRRAAAYVGKYLRKGS